MCEKVHWYEQVAVVLAFLASAALVIFVIYSLVRWIV